MLSRKAGLSRTDERKEKLQIKSYRLFYFNKPRRFYFQSRIHLHPSRLAGLDCGKQCHCQGCPNGYLWPLWFCSWGDISTQRVHFALRPQKRDGLLGTGTGGRGRKSEGSTADTARKRPERPWTAAWTMEVLKQCPLTIAQRLVHWAIAVSAAVLGQSHNVRCTAVEEQPEAKEVQLSQPSSTSLLMISSRLTWRSSSTSLL